jgi:hypothetical protein
MKKTKLICSAMFFLFAAAVFAACASVPKEKAKSAVPMQFWGEMEAFEYNGMQYVNHRNGYVVYSGGNIKGNNGVGGRNIKIVGSKNFNAIKKQETFLGFTNGFIQRLIVNGWILSYDPQMSVAGVEAKKLVRAFQDKYAELAGYVGYVGGGIWSVPERGRFAEGEKFNTGIWLDRIIEEIGDSIWLPMAWGDSTSKGGKDLVKLNKNSKYPIASFSGVSFLLYNRQQEKVYVVKDEFADIWAPSWGDPINDIDAHTFIANGKSVTQKSQLFLNGYAYIDGTTPVWVPSAYSYMNGEHTYQ